MTLSINTLIRRAQPEESATLTQIAHAAKRHWGYPERWISLWKDALTITPEFILDNEVYAAIVSDEIVGFYALLLNCNKLALEHMWVAPAHIGTGLGTKLFSHAVEKAISLNASFIEIDADPHAEGFYERMGAQRVGEISADIEGQTRVLPRFVVAVEGICR